MSEPASPKPAPQERPWGSIVHRPDRAGFYVLVEHAGQRLKRAAGSTWAQADKRRRALRVLVEQGIGLDEAARRVFGDRASAPTFAVLAPSYLAWAATKKKPSTLTADAVRMAALLRAPWASKRLDALRVADLVAWQTARQAPREVKRRRPRRAGETLAEYRRDRSRWYVETVPGPCGATLNRDAALGSALWEWARKAGHVAEDVPNPFRRLERSRETKGREVYLTAAEAAALVAAAAPALRPVLVFALSTGCRRGELLALPWRAVDTKRGTVHVEPATAKSGKGRVLGLTAEARAALEELRERRTRPALDASDPVALLPDGSPLDARTLRLLFASALARCEGIAADKRGEVTWHTLRHTFATLAAQAGVSLHALQGLLGHGSARMLARYAHHAPDANREALARFEGAVRLLPVAPPASATSAS